MSVGYRFNQSSYDLKDIRWNPEIINLFPINRYGIQPKQLLSSVHCCVLRSKLARFIIYEVFFACLKCISSLHEMPQCERRLNRVNLF